MYTTVTLLSEHSIYPISLTDIPDMTLPVTLPVTLPLILTVPSP